MKNGFGSFFIAIVALALAAGCSQEQAPVEHEIGYDGTPDPANSGGGVDRLDEQLVYFDSTKLGPFVGGKLTKVKICYSEYQGNPATHDFTVRVYGKGTASAPGTKLFEGVYTLLKGWNIVVLPSPIDIDAATEIWAGYAINTKNSWPISSDNESTVPNVNFFRYGDTGPYTVSTYHNLNARIIVQ